MSELSEARVVEKSLAARHERLCRQYDAGKDVLVALRHSEIDWAAAKTRLARLETGAA